MSADELRAEIESLARESGEIEPARARAAVERLLGALERGEVRAAEPGEDGWHAVSWVKQGILLGFRVGRDVETGDGVFRTLVQRGDRGMFEFDLNVQTP